MEGKAPMKRALLVAAAAVLIAGLLSSAGAGESDEILRVSDGERVTFPILIDDLKEAQVVLAGELHSEQKHHQAQLSLIRALKEAGVPVAVGLEMFRSDHQGYLDRWVRGEMREETLKDIYYANWSFDWNLYRDIFLYAREAGIPLIGLNISRDITRQVAEEGFSSLTSDELAQLPPVSCSVDATYRAFIRRAFGMHGHDQGKNFTHFCEAQIVWDTAMASNVLTFLDENPEYTIVVLAGSGHAWKRGIPEQISRQSDTSYRVILPEIQERLESENVTWDDADYLWLGL
jgi:uncharacterized iron-regulated protein